MQLGMIGLGRMGANMVRRLVRNGHECVVFDHNAASVKQLAGEGAVGASSLDDFIGKLKAPRAVWLMLPAAVVDGTLKGLAAKLQKDDIVIDGGNSYYIDDIRRAKELEPAGIHYVDVGTSGGVWGLERGYCMMIGGPKLPSSGSIRFSRLLPLGAATCPEPPVAKRRRAPPKMATCTPGRSAAGTSSKWCTTESNTA